jgi:predicted ATP-dependent serine protease
LWKLNNNEISENDSEDEVFKCSDCGEFVDKDCIKCPKCGSYFDEDEDNEISVYKKDKYDNFERKYKSLNKLKKLLDNDIITKEEFDEEKKKILNKKTNKEE